MKYIQKLLKKLVIESLEEINFQSKNVNEVDNKFTDKYLSNFIAKHPDIIKQMREWISDCQWGDIADRNDIDDLSDIEVLKGVESHYDGGIKQFIIDSDPSPTSEGYGYVKPSDIAKDPKHTTNKTTGKNQRWTVKFNSEKDLKKHGVDESITLEEVKSIVREILKEVEHPNKKYIISGKSGPATTYFCSSDTQGERMVQFGHSMAHKFDTELEVRKKIKQLENKYKGITDWKIEIIKWPPTDSSVVWKPIGKEVKLGHQVFKPVKKNDEWVVIWKTDGKRDENKTYYTNDKEDAVATYNHMLKNAEELNKKGNQ